MMFIQIINRGQCLFWVSVLFVCSCNNGSSKNETVSVGDTVEITLDHVIDKREGCRFTTFYFELILRNETDKRQQIEMTPAPDHCKRSIDESKIWWVKGTDRKPLTLASSKYKEVIVSSNEQKRVKLKGVFKVQGKSLEQISSIYKDWFETGRLVYQGNKLSLKEVKGFSLKFLIDDQQIIPNDSVAFSRTMSLPNFNADTLLDKGQVPTTEIELLPWRGSSDAGFFGGCEIRDLGLLMTSKGVPNF